MAFGHGTRGYIEGLFAYRTVDYDRDPGAIDDQTLGNPADAAGANFGPAKLSNILASPFLGIATDAGVDGLAVGIGVYVPFGGQATWDQNPSFADNAMYPGAVDGTARWASIEGEQRSLYYTLAGAWRHPSGKFSIGLGVNLVQSRIDIVRARNADGTDNLVTPGGSVAEGRSLLEVSDLTLAGAVGVMVAPTPCSRIGLSYQSQPGFGEMTLDGTLTNKFGAGPVSVLDVQMRQTLPDIIRLGGEWRAFRNASLHASVDYQRWSAFENQCLVDSSVADANCQFNDDGSAGPDASGIVVNLPRRWKDTVAVRAGGRYFATDAIEINGGVTYDTNAVPDDTIDPSLFDMNKVVGQAGLTWTSKRMSVALTLAHVLYFERTTAPRDPDPVAPSKNPDMAGTYAQQVTYALFGIGVAM